MNRSDFVGAFVLIAICLGIMLWSHSTWKSYAAPDSIQVPISEASKTAAVIFPSDFQGSGGLPYIRYNNLTFETLPKDALCYGAPDWRNSNSWFIFDCAWSTEEGAYPYARAYIHLKLPKIKGVDKWTYHQASLSISPIMLPWWVANIGALFVFAFAGFFAFCTFYTTVETVHRKGWPDFSTR